MDNAVVAKACDQERDIVLKTGDQGSDDYLDAESSKPSSTFDTPRASSVATPRGSVKSTPRATPAPKKYVSPMAKAREEKKRRQAGGDSTKCKDWPNLSDMESSSNPSSGSLNSNTSTSKPANLPKFGEWDRHSANSGPCYTLLFQNAAQEKKSGGLIRVHADGPLSPGRTEDLYKFAPATAKPRKRMHRTLLCCFS